MPISTEYQMSRVFPALLFSLLVLLPTEPLAAQEAPGTWNSERALELVRRARERRARPQVDSTLQNYRAEANGYVYYFLDREDSDERTLGKVDQIALEVYWAAPGHTKQRIIGLRDRTTLPVRIYYHLDHLTVIQNEFDDRIRMGDGDEVRDVLHPAAPGSDSVYDFRVADSLTLRLGGAPEPIRVYEIEVRPRRIDRPAVIGSMFLDRATTSIVRMAFTFTPASYVDPRLDYIRVSLDNALWEGRYWLPYEQQFELRRQVPELDFPAGGVIRGTMRIGNYRLNEELPPSLFRGPRVVALPERLRKNHEFDADIFAELDEQGLSPTPNLAALRDQAIALIGRRYLSGLPRLRLYIPNASSVLRFNRAEGVFLGGGLSYVPNPSLRSELATGFASGPGHLATSANLRLDLDPATRLRFHGDWNVADDLGLRPGRAGVLNTLSAVIAGEDYLDPYYVRGGRVELERRLGEHWYAGFGLRFENHRSATLEQNAAPLDDGARFRPVRPVDEGTLFGATGMLRRTGPIGSASSWDASLAVEAGRLEESSYARPVLELSVHHQSTGRSTTVSARAAAGGVSGAAPVQRLFLIGGPGTLPGYEYRSFIGDRFAVAEAEISRTLFSPWVRLRGLAAVGWTDLVDVEIPDGWDAAPTGGLRASAGFGFGLIHDVLRIDWARPVGRSGDWKMILSVHPGLSDIL